MTGWRSASRHLGQYQVSVRALALAFVLKAQGSRVRVYQLALGTIKRRWKGQLITNLGVFGKLRHLLEQLRVGAKLIRKWLGASAKDLGAIDV
eukprot:m.3340 g.3340  ORF g.3340 m.3340 type:complete len:93 (+) comp2296_c0_seq1:25-303(+)